MNKIYSYLQARLQLEFSRNHNNLQSSPESLDLFSVVRLHTSSGRRSFERREGLIQAIAFPAPRQGAILEVKVRVRLKVRRHNILAFQG